MPTFDFPARVQFYEPGRPVTEVPARPGIYLLFDEGRRVRRMATTRDLRARARYYLHERDDADALSVARREAAALGWLPTLSPFETQLAHLHLFRAFFPEGTQALYRLPSPHLLRLTLGEPYPRLEPARSVRAPEHLHIGPFLTRDQAEAEAVLVNDLLSLRRCDYVIVPYQPYERCLYLQMRTCVAPCDACPQPDYFALAEQAAMLLGGNVTEALATLADRRDAAAADLRFEEAMRWRDAGRKVEQWQASRPPFLRPLPALNLVVPQRTEAGLDLFLVRAGALVGWLRLSEPTEEGIATLLTEAFTHPWQPPAWPAMRDDFAFLARWLWSRDAGAHVLVDDPTQAAAHIMPYAIGEAGEIAEEGTAEEVEV